MRLSGVFAALGICSCLQIGSGTDDAGTGAAGSMAPVGDAQAESPPIGGTGCAVDSISGATLCTALDQCPGVVVDHDLYPDCGFRVPAITIDLQCVCGDFLCPVGAVLNCAQAAKLLADQSEALTCVQQNEGRCAPRGMPKPKVGTTCDPNCADACAGDFNCRKLCGC